MPTGRVKLSGAFSGHFSVTAALCRANSTATGQCSESLITTIAGGAAALRDGGPAIAAQLHAPTNLALDSAGNLYVADTQNSRVRIIKPDGAIAAFAGTGTGGALVNPAGMAVDKAGTVYIGDAAGVVWAVTPDGGIHTIAGAGADPSNAGFSGDSGPAQNAEFNDPGSLAIPKGLPNAGNVMIFNNGVNRAGGNYSSVDELVLPVDASGNYPLTAGSRQHTSWTFPFTARRPALATLVSLNLLLAGAINELERVSLVVIHGIVDEAMLSAHRELQRIMVRRRPGEPDDLGAAQRSARGPHRDRAGLGRYRVIPYLHYSAQAAIHVRVGLGRVVVIVAGLVFVAIKLVESYRG